MKVKGVKSRGENKEKIPRKQRNKENDVERQIHEEESKATQKES